MSSINFENSTITTSVFGDLVNQANFDNDNVTLNLYPVNYSTSLLLTFLGLPHPTISSMNDQRTILNFDGTQGSTDFIEETAHLTPSMMTNCQIDTNWKVFGSGSFGATLGSGFGILSYDISPLFDFTMQYFCHVGSAVSYSGVSTALFGSNYISFNIFGVDYPTLEEIIGYEGQELPIAVISHADENNINVIRKFISEIDLNTSYHVCIELTAEKQLMIFLNGIKVLDENILISSNLFDSVGLSVEEGSYIDAFELTHEILYYDNFTVPTVPPAPQTFDVNYPLSTNASLLILSETQSENFVDELNIYGSCSIAGAHDSTAIISIGDINIFNIDGETKKYYYLNGLNQMPTILRLNGDLSQDIDDNKLFLDTFTLYKSSGVVSVSSTYLVDCFAADGAEFNASVSRRNIDGDGNVGWIFTSENTFIPKIVMIF